MGNDPHLFACDVSLVKGLCVGVERVLMASTISSRNDASRRICGLEDATVMEHRLQLANEVMATDFNAAGATTQATEPHNTSSWLRALPSCTLQELVEIISGLNSLAQLGT